MNSKYRDKIVSVILVLLLPFLVYAAAYLKEVNQMSAFPKEEQKLLSHREESISMLMPSGIVRYREVTDKENEIGSRVCFVSEENGDITNDLVAAYADETNHEPLLAQIEEENTEYETIEDEPVPLAQSIPQGNATIDEVASQPVSEPFVQNAPIYSDDIMGALTKINAQRVERGLSEYQWSDTLASAAQIRAQEASSFWSHSRPNGTEFYTVNSSVVYGENLAANTKGSVLMAVDNWTNSPGHASLLYDVGFRAIGIGTYQSNGYTYIAAEFGY